MQEVQEVSNATDLSQTMEDYARSLTSQALQSAIVMSVHGSGEAASGESMNGLEGSSNGAVQVPGQGVSADKQHDVDLLHLVGWSTTTGVPEEGEHELDVFMEGESQGEAQEEANGEVTVTPGHGEDNADMSVNGVTPPRVRLRAPREAFFNDEVSTSDGSFRVLGRMSKDKYTLPSRRKRTEREKLLESLKSSLNEVKDRMEASPVQLRPDLVRIPVIAEE
eukprot:TRINITY_DN17017_c0_g1_i1.p1 TRINITY_DN17017_c0_g1~~TRINITY_DN17017_c0_g1_i1.p1  ORF type:complete len:222 (+),score=43.76 TRINITY_DN17017_c0_g1_i1:117-782(+)